MFDSPVINLVILLSFIYFIGSLLVSTINEAIASVFNMRSTTLKQGINKMLLQPDWKTYVKTEFMSNPFIESLMKKKGKLPSYIPAKNFALAILENCKFYNCCGNVPQMKDAVNTCVLPPSMQKLVLAMLDHTQGDVKKMQDELERFYDNAMDRVSGWYKKKIQVIIIIISIILAGFLNIDTIRIIKDSLKDTAKLDATVNKITEVLPSIQTDGGVVNVIQGNDTISVKSMPPNVKKTTIPDSVTARSATLSSLNSDAAEVQALTVLYSNTTGRPIGYTSMAAFKTDWFSSVGGFFIKFIGILLTAFAVQMGSNYWFDLLNKFVNLRGSGKKPERSQPEPQN